MNNKLGGYDTQLFTYIDEQFECLICSNIVRDPKECNGCGSLYCKCCIDDWLQKKKECPKRCDMSLHQIIPVQSKALLRIYNNLDMKCPNNDCEKQIKLSDYAQHEIICNSKQCLNFQVCKNKENQQFGNKQICSLECDLQYQLLQQFNKQEQLKIISQFLKNQIQKPQNDINQQAFQQIPQKSQIQQQSNIIPQGLVQLNDQLQWNPNCSGTGIKLYNNNTHCWLQESSYMFRTILADQAFYQGAHYWEIHADDRTENELKIGVSIKKDFNYNSAFCDFEYGFAFYGLGQLRHGSNASGPSFGQRFKKEGYLGIFLNMNKGQLSFALNGNFLGIAFTNEVLKKGPIYPAVSLLHQAGCKIKSGLPLPNYFPV
ncbi:spry domain protein [Ichthyophthirius multifiliis]|uniref:Spry domain protein n=1 Tax=Ichthyophthirius multifiliis TaxID=5932 RepID=G0QXX3_ICHMU|nr:spry domain protein [Ichthyophthirius multifiliis]EGR29925.1 spry domain protein [Ichthyophthirius multifiliis]|eukprot:XP_004031161.1 spry domain protein [Ichthyophthirius multifiliis]